MKIILSVIAVCLVMITVKLYTPDAEADDRDIIKRILYCIDGSKITNGGTKFVTYCNG